MELEDKAGKRKKGVEERHIGKKYEEKVMYEEKLKGLEEKLNPFSKINLRKYGDLGTTDEGKEFCINFLKSVSGLEEKITSLSSSKTDLKLYNSGAGCINDLLSSSAENMMRYMQESSLLDKLEREEDDLSKKSAKEIIVPFLKEVVKEAIKNAWKIPFLPIIKKLGEKNLEYVFNGILGAYDILWTSSMFSNNMYGTTERFNQGTISIVLSNIERIAEKTGIKKDDLTRYVLVHESVHRRQLYNFPELNEKRYKLAIEYGVSVFKRFFGGLDNAARRKERVKSIRKLEELQSLMTVIEGHADYYSAKVMSELLPNFEEFKARLKKVVDFKQKFYSALLRVLYDEKFSKEDQYKKGRKFIKALDEAGGTSLVNKAFKRMPTTLEEINKPQEYLKKLQSC